MKKILLPLLGLCLLSVLPATRAAVIITDFGSDEFTPFSSTFDSNAQTPNQISLVGTEGSRIYGTLSAPVDISGFTSALSITGIYTGTYNEQFVIDLVDGSSGFVTYNGFYALFNNGVSTTVPLAYVTGSGTFDPTNVTSVQFTAGSGGTSKSVDLVITDLSAVPEPATWALAAGGLLALLGLRRRRSA